MTETRKRSPNLFQLSKIAQRCVANIDPVLRFFEAQLLSMITIHDYTTTSWY